MSRKTVIAGLLLGAVLLVGSSSRGPFTPVSKVPFAPAAADVKRNRPINRRPTPLAQAIALNRRAPFLECVDQYGLHRRYRPGIVLVKFKNAQRIEAIEVPPGSEPEERRRFERKPDVEFAELDVVLTRQSVPNDPQFREQWHHAKIRSTNAWDYGFGGESVTLAIVDAPFQMNHPDLAAHTVAGWDMVRNTAILSDPIGYYHSTIAAGMAAAVIDNGVGVSGASNCKLMPIDIGDEPTASDMHDAVIWAADHGIRVVNLSWDGAFSSVINQAGAYLKEKTGGMLFMSGVNGTNQLNYTNQPNIYAVAMTDAADVSRSSFGDHIDFAAPGHQIYSTTTNSTYEVDSGTSYSAPLLAGIAAWIMAVNPALGPDDIENILKASCIDLGQPGWDPNYGWGRIDFATVAQRTIETLPANRIGVRREPFAITAVYQPNALYELFRTEDLGEGAWQKVENAALQTNAGTLLMIDPSPSPRYAFYRVRTTAR